ncbi:MAG: glycosyltransferase 87 family protein [Cyanobacteria bacterium P01_F01_bin.13]
MTHSNKSVNVSPGLAPRLVVLWSRHGQRLLQVGIGLMIVAAIWRLGLELPRLIWGQGDVDAVDLISRHREVARWFARLPVYGAIPNGDYPPASYPLFWPWVGWLSREATRWFWAVTTLLLLGALGWLGIKESRAATRWEKVFIALMPFALYPASAGIRVGQVATHLMPPLVLGLLLMGRSRNGWGRDLLAAALVIFAMIKPTMSAPFFWVVCFMPGRWRPVLLVSIGYLALALLAGQYQQGNLLSLHLDWLDHAGTQLGTRGHASLHTWLEAINLSDWMLPASLLLLAAGGIWTAIYRKAHPWILLSMAAMVARFWVDHQVFDDLLLWIPLIALFRFTRLDRALWVRLAAAILFALNWFALMAPARFLTDYHPLSGLAVPIQTTIWLMGLLFFMVLAQQDRTQETA